jgi:hypothetical protein
LAGFIRDDGRRQQGWRSGILTGERTPGLMLGLAGIAWGQLRAALPGRLPPAWIPAIPQRSPAERSCPEPCPATGQRG